MESENLLTKLFAFLDEGDATAKFKEAGFKGNVSHLARFIARKKFAQNFSGITVENMSTETNNGYYSLLRLSMVYSAFENYVILLHGDKNNYYANASEILKNENSDEVLKEISEIDYDMEIWNFISEVSNGTISKEIKFYKEGSLINIIYLAAGIRHIFLHGLLTPNVKKSDPGDITIICKKISQYLIDSMNAHFGEKLQQFAAKLEQKN